MEVSFFFALALIISLRCVGGKPFSENLFRGSLFQVVSLLTTTRFISDDYEHWSLATHVILLFLMFIGGCTSSTGRCHQEHPG
jgi:trk system potassium uptake protein TrkH